MNGSVKIFDFAVIGAGAAGVAAAKRAAQLGAKVAIIERESVGGTCLNYGCIPTKYLLHHGVGGERLENLKRLLQKGSAEELTKLGVRLLTGFARFDGVKSLKVATSDGEYQIGAEKILIATGGCDRFPSFMPDSPSIVDTRGFLELEALPSSVVVAGGGAAGCEIAAICSASNGSEVVLLEASSRILPGFDADAAALVSLALRKNGRVEILTDSAIKAVAVDNGGKVKVQYVGGETTADLMVCAIGRIPCTGGLGLEALGIALDGKGYIRVDDNGYTGVGGIYAAGDVVAGGDASYASAVFGAGQVAELLFGANRRVCRRDVPRVVFTNPPVAMVGAFGDGLAQSFCPLRNNVKAMITGDTEGFVKLSYHPATGKIAGAVIVGAGAEDMIATVAVAMRGGLGIADFADGGLFAHPVRSEVLRTTAEIAGWTKHSIMKR